MMMMMMMMMAMTTNTIPYRRTKTHIWDKVLMGIWVHPLRMTTVMMIFLTLPPKKNDGDDTFSLGAFNGEHTADGSVRGMWWMQMCTIVKLVSLFLEQPSLF